MDGWMDQDADYIVSFEDCSRALYTVLWIENIFLAESNETVGICKIFSERIT